MEKDLFLLRTKIHPDEGLSMWGLILVRTAFMRLIHIIIQNVILSFLMISHSFFRPLIPMPPPRFLQLLPRI
jgi:hypothetical protein